MDKILYINTTTAYELWHNTHTNEIVCVIPYGYMILTTDYVYLRSEQRSTVASMLCSMYVNGDVDLLSLRA